ncbi:MAG: glutamate--cysteine ligase [Hyphomonadaceae bacterium]|nr:glutamate--cysteine ligase [Hyphomonadaceae bacterium]MBY0423778.1 glutamate--cysteine ligase [Parvularculaceae bacterium]
MGLADTKEKSPELTGFRDLVAHLEKGPRPDRSTWRIGTEHEKFAFDRTTLRPIAYEGPNGIGALLNKLADKYGWERIYEGENVIALKSGLASISLEPGGQFELSGAPLENLHQTCAETGSHLSQLRDVCDDMNIAFLGVGFQPLWALDDIPIMPKGRYGIMRNYMQKVGRLGRQMMFRSCTVQVNLDFASEADMVKKFRVGLALQPIATALFAASPFAEGRLNGYLSYRGHVWSDTDPDRTGMLPFVFEQGMGFERYAKYALDVPMYFVYRDGKYIDASGQSFRAFMDGKLPALPGERPTLKDWEDHLTTIFPEVRLKTYLEMRGADAGPWSRLCALPAFWAGILYDDAATEAAWSLVKSWTAEDRESLRRAVPVLGLRAPIRGNSAQDIAQAALAIARQGLKSRAQSDNSGQDETHFLTELDDIASSGVTPAERLIERYRTEWGGDVKRVFEACAY